MSRQDMDTLLDSDVGLTLPLALGGSAPQQALRLIEASAGTGKTFTLATLYLRALLEQRRRVPEVLVVTFTEAATAELHLRLRARLVLAASQLAAFRRGTITLDDDPAADTESRLVRATLHRALVDDNDVDALDRHLSLCLLDLDQAPISTLHGFCQRVLSEHAFASGHLLDPGELDGDDRLRLQEVCDALWREIADAGDARARAMTAMWNRPEEMAAALRQLLAQPAPLLPDPRGDARSGGDEATLQARFEKLVDAWREDGAGARAALQQSLADLKANIYSTEKLDEAFTALAGLVQMPQSPSSLHERLPLLGQAKIEQATKTAARNAGRIARHRLFDAVDALLAAIEASDERRVRLSIGLLHDLREDAAARLAELKRRRRVRSFDDLIDDLDRALDEAGRGKALAAAIRRSHPLALVDEFQDTDDRQWRILQRVYAEPAHAAVEAVLVLVGDPKQAIYRFRNGDIHTYLRAASQVPQAWRLPQNFRSRPSLVAAVNDIFDARQRASADTFVDPRILFQPVDAALDDDRVLLRDGEPPAALELWSPPPAAGGERRKGDMERIALDATVADICDWLQAARRGEASVAEGHARRALRPGDIAVLVGTHQQATRVQQALSRHGVAAVRAGQESLFATDEAIELHRLLRALLREGDGRALRAALATDLVGLDAAAIAALDDDDGSGFDLGVVAEWRRCWRQRGSLTLLERLLLDAAPRWLSRHDGARRFANTRHLAELLDEARRSLHDSADVLRWLERHMADADPRNEAEQPRLETDADRVQVMTVHKSKGLEFGIVYLPFIALPSAGRSNQRLSLFRYHEANDEQRWRACIGRREAPEDAAAEAAMREEELAESLRLVYVAMTRARWALRAFWAPWTRASDYGLSHLFGAEGLHDGAAGDCLDSVAAAHAGRIAHRRLSGDETASTLPPESGTGVPLSARIALPRLRDDWRRHSFSALVRDVDASVSTEAAADDERPGDATVDGDSAIGEFAIGDSLPGNAGPAGPGFGNAVHAMLESAAFADWKDGDALRAPANAARALDEALRREGIDPDRIDNAASARQQAHRLAIAGVTAPLPTVDGDVLRLIDLPPDHCQPELEFELRLRASRGDALLRLLQAHGYLVGVAQFGARAEHLEGLLHGFIDLVYRHGDAFYLLDYKTNRLPAYDDAALAAAMREHHYDLQYLLYALALHRWLRQRLGAAYDSARHFGGVRYLFLRGRVLRGRVAGDQSIPATQGVFSDRPSATLLDAMDALFEGSTPANDGAPGGGT